MILVYWIIAFLSHLVPKKAAIFTSERIANLMYFTFYRRRRKIVISNLKKIDKDMSLGKVKKLVMKIYENFARFIYEFLILPNLSKGNLSDWLNVEHLEYLDATLKSGKGAIVLTAHLGNWELGAGMLGVLGYSPIIIAFPHSSRLVKNFFTRRREAVGSKVVYLREGLFRAISSLKRGGVITTVGDRVYSGPAHEANFFGKPFSFPRGIFELAERTQASIVPAFCVRENGKYVVHFEPPLTNGIEEWAGVLERYVKKYKSQWFLFDPL